MNDSQIKEGIERVIGEEKWLTEDVIKKLSTTKRPRKRPSLLLKPVLAVLVICCIAVFIFIVSPSESEPQTSSQIQEVQFFRAVEDKNVAQTVLDYLQAIEHEDGIVMQEISSTEVVTSYKEIFGKYENVDFSTMKLLKIAPLEGNRTPVYTAYITFEDKLTNETYINKLNIKVNDEQSIKISENLYDEWPLYTEFTAPEEFTFSYGAATIPVTNSDFALQDKMLAAQSIEIDENRTGHFYMHKDNVQFVIQEGDLYTDFGNVAKYKEDVAYYIYPVNFDNGDQMYVVGNEKDHTVLYFYYSEMHNNYQYLNVEDGINTELSDINNDGSLEIFLNNPAQIATIDNGELRLTSLPWQINELHEWHYFLSFELRGQGIIIVTYNDEWIQKTYYYKMVSLDKAVSAD
mgnify:FL=1